MSKKTKILLWMVIAIGVGLTTYRYFNIYQEFREEYVRQYQGNK